MKRAFSVFVSITVLAIATNASADQFSLTFTPYYSTDQLNLDLTANYVGSDVYNITFVTGEVDGVAINSPTSNYLNGNGYLNPSDPTHYLSQGGFSFVDADNVSWNLFESQRSLHYDLYGSNGNVSVGNVIVTPTPEPQTLVALGVGVLGLIRLKWKRSKFGQ